MFCFSIVLCHCSDGAVCFVFSIVLCNCSCGAVCFVFHLIRIVDQLSLHLSSETYLKSQ
jgi:hypothetical protein